MTEYNIEPNEHEGIVCECCAHPKAKLHEFRINYGEIGHDPHKEKFKKFCYICASSYFSQIVGYPDFHKDQGDMAKSLGYLFNELFLKIDELKNK